MIKSLDELRKDVDKCTQIAGEKVWITKSALLKDLDAIEREVEERYIERPIDADGISVHVNDEIESVYSPDRVFIVKRLKYSEKHGWMIGGAIRDDLSEYHLYDCRNCHHHKSPTVEDVLRVFASHVRNDAMKFERISDETIAEYAAKLQLREAE